jgi:hypothetical protein
MSDLWLELAAAEMVCGRVGTLARRACCDELM